MIHLLCPNKKLKMKANSKPCTDSEIIPAILTRDELIKKYKKSCVKTDNDQFWSTKNGSPGSIFKKNKSFFRKKI